jgi:hypothetical protein
MERHVERLIAACGLAQFSYRTWPGTEILLAEPAAELAGGIAAEPPSEAAPRGATGVLIAVSTPPAAATAAATGTEDDLVATRARSLLASLSKFIAEPLLPTGSDRRLDGDRRSEDRPPPRLASQPARSRGPLSLPSAEGFEAPIHVGYRERAERPPARRLEPVPGHAAAPAASAPVAGRRFALLDEMLPAPHRPEGRRDRRGASSTS